MGQSLSSIYFTAMHKTQKVNFGTVGVVIICMVMFEMGHIFANFHRYEAPEIHNRITELEAALRIKYQHPTTQLSDHDTPVLDCPTTDSLTKADKERLQKATERRNYYQKMYFDLFCSLKPGNVTPTGGFCVTKEHYSVGGNIVFDQGVAAVTNHQIEAHLLKGIEEMILTDKTVGDFGAGLGWYSKYWRKNGKAKSVDAWDGSSFIEEVTQNEVKFLDLTEDQAWLPVYDWVVSLEVAEHIPRELEPNYLKNVHEHNKEGVVISWALPQQGGHAHVNERTNDEVATIFTQMGYTRNKQLEKYLRNSIVEATWFRYSIMVFHKNQ